MEYPYGIRVNPRSGAFASEPAILDDFAVDPSALASNVRVAVQAARDLPFELNPRRCGFLKGGTIEAGQARLPLVGFGRLSGVAGCR